MREEQEYFGRTPPPPQLGALADQVRAFLSAHPPATTPRICLLTSGGTTVPLEHQMVRFLDNFSAGTRGAASAERLVDAGYVVLFLHRQHSLEPYSRWYSHSRNCFLDYLVRGGGGVGPASVASVT